MIGSWIDALRNWQPAAREKTLLWLLALLCVAGFVYAAWDSKHSAQAEAEAAQQRLAKVQTQFKLLSNNGWRGEIEVQKRLLLANALTDATPAIGQLRLRGEAMAIARSSGLGNPEIIDAYRGEDPPSGKAARPRFTPLVTTIEFDFDWTGLMTLLGQLETAQRGYFIDGFAVREEGPARRMRLTLRALHRTQRPGA